MLFNGNRFNVITYNVVSWSMCPNWYTSTINQITIIKVNLRIVIIWLLLSVSICAITSRTYDCLAVFLRSFWNKKIKLNWNSIGGEFKMKSFWMAIVSFSLNHSDYPFQTFLTKVENEFNKKVWCKICCEFV